MVKFLEMDVPGQVSIHENVLLWFYQEVSKHIFPNL